MPYPHIFATLPAGNVPASYLDDNFNAVATSGPYTPPGTGAVATTVGAKLAQITSVFDYMTAAQIANVQAGLASIDCSASIQAAITFLGTAGGTVLFPAGNYLHNSSIVPASNVVLTGYYATLTYGGVGTQIAFPTTGFIRNFQLQGFQLAYGSATTSIALYSAYQCRIMDIYFTGASTTALMMDLRCNNSGPTNPEAGYNCVHNYFENIFLDGSCGTFIRLQGNSISGVVTLNTFHHVQVTGPASGVNVRGIDFSQWCDNNYFSGQVRINILAVNAVGAIWNSAAPAVANGVYCNNFDHLAVDAFGGPFAGRVGAQMNLTYQNKIGMFYQNPVAEGGDLVITGNTQSYDVTKSVSALAQMQRAVFGCMVTTGPATSTGASYYAGNFALTGTSPASFVAADNFPATATGAATGFAAVNSSAASVFTIATYYGFSVVNFNKGAGSAVTNQIGYYCSDLTSGANNYAFYGNVSSGANKYNCYMPGTASNLFGGNIYVPGGANPILSTSANVTSGAGAQAGTLTNSPVAGNPTKWIPFNDNGATRYIPAW